MMLIRFPNDIRLHGGTVIMLLSIVLGNTLGCASRTTTAAVTPMESSCLEWTASSDEERFSVVGAALEQQVGGPASSNLASCLWLVSEQIAHQASASCEREGGDFETAMGRALTSAVNYCE